MRKGGNLSQSTTKKIKHMKYFVYQKALILTFNTIFILFLFKIKIIGLKISDFQKTESDLV